MFKLPLCGRINFRFTADLPLTDNVNYSRYFFSSWPLENKDGSTVQIQVPDNVAYDTQKGDMFIPQTCVVHDPAVRLSGPIFNEYAGQCPQGILTNKFSPHKQCLVTLRHQAAPGTTRRACYECRAGLTPRRAGYEWRAGLAPRRAGYEWRAGLTPRRVVYEWRAGLAPRRAGYEWRAGLTPRRAVYEWRAGLTPRRAVYEWRAGLTPRRAVYEWRAGLAPRRAVYAV